MKLTAKPCGHGLALSFSHKAKPGGANRDRTGDLLLAKQALSQLSYGPGDPGKGQLVVGLGGLEPPTPRLSSVCSNQLSYRPCISTCGRHSMMHSR
jgi:hypothetical protein